MPREQERSTAIRAEGAPALSSPWCLLALSHNANLRDGAQRTWPMAFAGARETRNASPAPAPAPGSRLPGLSAVGLSQCM
jgi:hypothetical protein